uniref:Uncharacterized protein n=1 Tax=Macaca fascicularis TaxID=9541 RepID=A0A7N9C8G4_MACFA
MQHSITYYSNFLSIVLKTGSPSVTQAGVQWLILACCSLNLPDSSIPSTSATLVAGITGVYHYAHLIVVFFVEMGFYQVAQAGLELLDSNHPPTLASQSVGFMGVSHRAWQKSLAKKLGIIVGASFSSSSFLIILKLISILTACIHALYSLLHIYIYVNSILYYSAGFQTAHKRYKFS